VRGAAHIAGDAEQGVNRMTTTMSPAPRGAWQAARSGARMLLACAAALLACAVQAAATDVTIEPYPRAVPLQRYDNPLERGALPISVPDRGASGERVSRVRLPYEARVSMAQYRHAVDDSPLLIARHYAGQLQKQGFELLTVCETPCRSASGLADSSVYWKRELDLANKLEMRPFGDNGIYLIGHRADAVVAVRVGSWDSASASTVKIVQAPGIDRTPITQYIESQRAPVVSASLPPPPRPARVAASAGAAGGERGVQLVAPRDAAELIARSKGILVVQVTSFDTACGFCVRSNDVFDTLARDGGASAPKFIRITYQPWGAVSRDGFAQSYGVNGLPTFFTMKDGQLVRRRNGIATADELRKLLLEGVD